jgi:hypothetical protein
MPLEDHPSFKDDRLLIIVEPTNSTRFKQLRLTKGNLNVYTSGPGALTVHQYQVDG